MAERKKWWSLERKGDQEKETNIYVITVPLSIYIKTFYIHPVFFLTGPYRRLFLAVDQRHRLLA